MLVLRKGEGSGRKVDRRAGCQHLQRGHRPLQRDPGEGAEADSVDSFLLLLGKHPSSAATGPTASTTRPWSFCRSPEMPTSVWSTQQPRRVPRGAIVERAAEALEAEVAAVVCGGGAGDPGQAGTRG